MIDDETINMIDRGDETQIVSIAVEKGGRSEPRTNKHRMMSNLLIGGSRVLAMKKRGVMVEHPQTLVNTFLEASEADTNDKSSKSKSLAQTKSSIQKSR